MSTITLFDCVLPLAAALSEDWVYRFLLEHTPESNLRLLTSRSHIERAFSGVNLYDSLKDTVFCVPKKFMEFFNTKWIMIPIRCSGRYSALIGIKESAPRPSFLKWPGEKAVGELANPTSILHAVQDIYTGQLCALGKGKKEMMHCMVVLNMQTPDAGRCKHRGFFTVPTDVLRKRQLAPIVASVKFLFHVKEQTECPSCESVCRCPVSMTQFQADPKRSLFSIGGSFNSSSSVSVIKNGSVMSSTPSVAFRTKMHGVHSPELIVRLLKWAISTTLATVLDQAAFDDSPCPTKLIEIAYRTMREVGALFNNTRNHLVNPNISLPSPSTQVNNNITSTATSPRPNFVAPVQQPSLPYSSSPLPNISLLELPTATEFPSLFDSDHQNQGGLHSADLFDPVQIELVLDSPSSQETVTLPGDTLRNSSTPEGESAPIVLPEIPEIECAAFMNQPVAPTSYPGNETERTVPNTCGSDISATLPPPEVQSIETEILQPVLNSKEARQLRRKIRNRESAARSNRRKQLFRAELKQSIAEYKTMSDHLRDRLEALQAENADLKMRVAAIDST